MTKQAIGKKWYDTRAGATGLALALAFIAYGVGSRAIYTGSLQQYVVAFVSFIAATNRALHAAFSPRYFGAQR